MFPYMPTVSYHPQMSTVPIQPHAFPKNLRQWCMGSYMPLRAWGLIRDCLHFATTTYIHVHNKCPDKQTIIGPIVTAIQCQAEWDWIRYCAGWCNVFPFEIKAPDTVISIIEFGHVLPLQVRDHFLSHVTSAIYRMQESISNSVLQDA